jgi:hypothetical protein
MSIDKRTEYLTRSGVLRLLSEDELAKVSNVETTARLAGGEEYLDLEQLDLGVRRANDIPEMLPMERLLPRKAVLDATWTKIVKYLASPAIPGVVG